MKFTIVGHFCVDVIHHSGAPETESFGGIMHAVAAMATIASPSDVIYPVFGVGERELGAVRERLSAFPNVNVGGLFELEAESNRVHLVYENAERRTECSQSIAPPIPFGRIEPYLGVHGVLIDMISGQDIALDTLDTIRLTVRPRGTPIHLDLHSLTLGVGPDGSRFRRAVSDWRRWCFMVNTVQMNEEEAAGLTMEHYTEETLARQMLPLMVNALCITRGAAGVTVFRQDHKKLLRDDVPADTSVEVVDTTGCGDVFAAAMLHRSCTSKDLVAAAAAAARIASSAAAYEGLGGVDALERFRMVNGK